MFVNGVTNVAAFCRRLIAAPRLSRDQLELKLLGGDTVKVVVKRLEDHRMIEAFLLANSFSPPPREKAECSECLAVCFERQFAPNPSKTQVFTEHVCR